MAERLTKYLYKESGECMQDIYSTKNKKQAIKKLGKLEDIMGKYHCNDIEELEQRLKLAHSVELLKDNGCDLSEYVIVTKSTLDNICPNFMKDAYFDSLIDKNLKLEQDRDAWRSACELAVRHTVGFEKANILEQVDWRETRVRIAQNWRDKQMSD